MVTPHRFSDTLLVFLLASIVGQIPVYGQAVDLLYDDGGVLRGERYVTIAHADAEGTVPPDTNVVRGADRLYFAFRPVGDWTFDVEDKQILRGIAPVQDTSALVADTLTLIGGEEGASAAVMGIPTSRIDWETAITFRHAVDTSAGLSLKERYAPGYPSLLQAYREGQQELNDGEPLRAIEALRPFRDPVEPRFSFVSEARALLDTASARVLNSARSHFRAVRQDLVEQPDLGGLARLDSFRVRIDSMQSVLGPLADAEVALSTDVRARIETLTRSADQLYGNARRTYRRETLRIFLRGQYEDPKLRLYLEGLTHLLLDVDDAFAASELQVDSLRVAVLQRPRSAEIRQQLQAQGWTAEFREVVRLVNENISERREVFGGEIMESLRLRRPAAPQPYYEIIAAMNALLADEQPRFSEAWGRALEKITDLTLLNDLERWRLARQFPPEEMSERAHTLAEEARSHRRSGELGAAEDRLQLAARLAGSYAPLYYELGQLKQMQGDTTEARQDFRRARELAPSYASPEVNILRQFLAQEEHDRALAHADSLLREQAYWLIYLPKAKALVETGRYDMARQVLRGRCEPLNDERYALYALLAETYVGLNTWEGVRWAVQQARTLTPQRSSFERRLAKVQSVAAEQGVSLTEAAGDSMSIEELREHADTTEGVGTVKGSDDL